MMQYSKFLTNVALLRQPSATHSLASFANIQNVIFLAGGMPNPQGFPFERCTFDLKDGTQFTLDENDIKVATQYIPSEGTREFYEWVKEHQKDKHNAHKLPYNWDCIITSGSQDALGRTFEMMIEPGDNVLIESATYPGALAALRPLQPCLHGLPVDARGIIPEEMEKILKQLDRPIKFLYVIPTGQNPTSATLTVARKKEIYRLACEYDFLILEDDPYYYLTFTQDHNNVKDSDISFLSMDTEGRVLRFDSISKVLGGGLRVGWCTGPAPLIERIHLHMQATALSASGLAQVAVSKLLNHTWGMRGLEKHVLQVQNLYRSKRDDFLECIEKYLKGYVEYSVPEAGMFLWMRIIDVEDTKELVMKQAMAKNVCLVAGEAFSPNGEKSSYVRAAFSLESKQNMDIACKRLAEILYEIRCNKK